MKIVSVVGARPQFIKAAIVSRTLRRETGITEVLVHTGQHYDNEMSGVFFEEMGLPRPDHNLGIGSGSHGRQTAGMLAGIEDILAAQQPALALVYGDTNSTIAGALAAAKLHIPVAHVEAGLRSFNRRMPEEINRVLTDHLSRLLLAPTEAAVAHLLREGIDPATVHLVGDVMYDASLHFIAPAEASSRIIGRLSLEPKGYVLATIHRAENTDDPALLREIVDGLNRVSRQKPVVWPVHPRTKKTLEEHGLTASIDAAIRLIPPVGYLDMLMLEKNAALVATDSGGVQKEAYFCRVPCVTLRTETEWVELVDLGWNVVAPPRDGSQIAESILCRLGTSGREADLFGGGRAVERIVGIIKDTFAVGGH